MAILDNLTSRIRIRKPNPEGTRVRTRVSLASRDRKIWLKVLFVVILMICGFTITEILHSSRLNRAFTLATTKNPEPVTELYFNNPQALPTQIKAGQTGVVNFHIANHESKTTTYRYIVIQSSASGQIPIDGGSVTLTDGSGYDQEVRFSLPNKGDTNEISIELRGRNEQIDFWAQAL